MLNKMPWLIPGAQSRQVTANFSIPLPGVGSTTVLSYQIPDGLRFALRGVVVNIIDPSGTWNEGSDQLLWQLQLVGTGGTRPVEFLTAIQTNLGSRLQPYPILGRCEFSELDVLNWVLTSDGSVTAGSPQYAVAHLMGWTYPALGCD